ncbi:SDR family oxidoreductase [Amycolatopsis echigonensis]|uniref:SDR family oxidoreductase n=1 Tax=Amycolatopsis echigonensis TaxID=2576905 RepID=A0A8E2B8Z8_9PSEU|nr:SDR family oxidoreductase [Amycolatopsis echigonensis]MBB2504887.1 SDR family oxidoreductase [Amycolatopsis echigonensis]
MTKRERVWLITGASGGLGSAFVRSALSAGDRVAAISRAQLDTAEPNTRSWVADVADADQIRQVVDEVVDAFGRVDIVVNNAGYAEPGAFEELPDAALRRQFEVNFFGAANVVRAVLPHLRAARAGHILQISSLAGQIGAAGMSAYTSSKHALEGLSVSLAAELSPLGIHVTIVEPGATATGFRQRWAERQRPASALADYDHVAAALAHTGASYRPPSEPDQIAQAVLALAGLEKPPIRIAVGADAVEGIGRARRQQLDDLETYRGFPSSR